MSDSRKDILKYLQRLHKEAFESKNDELLAVIDVALAFAHGRSDAEVLMIMEAKGLIPLDKTPLQLNWQSKSIFDKGLPYLYYKFVGRLRITITCSNCHKEFRPWSSSRAIFCSNKCQRKYDYQKRINIVHQTKNWWQGWQNSYTIRNYIIVERGVFCEICKNTEWMGKQVPLVLDHIDGNSNNWKDENMRLVCGNCDMQLSTYKNKNKGNGRYSRRKRYKEGKSY